MKIRKNQNAFHIFPPPSSPSTGHFYDPKRHITTRYCEKECPYSPSDQFSYKCFLFSKKKKKSPPAHTLRHFAALHFPCKSIKSNSFLSCRIENRHIHFCISSKLKRKKNLKSSQYSWKLTPITLRNKRFSLSITWMKLKENISEQFYKNFKKYTYFSSPKQFPIQQNSNFFYKCKSHIFIPMVL